MDIGTKLQQARIAKGLSLAHISNVTKMSSHVLHLIESGEFARLPGGLLTRGYLRAFATVVGLDPETIVSEYRSQFEAVSSDQEPLKLRTTYRDRGVPGKHAGLILMIGLAIFIFFVWPRSTNQPASVQFAAETSEVGVEEAATISKAMASSTQGAPLGGEVPSTAADRDGLQIELRPHAECWVSAVADGRLVIYRLMQSGERATINAHDDIQLRVGDAGALTYFVNGAAGRSLGAPGEAVTIRITTDNAVTWLTKEPPQVRGI